MNMRKSSVSILGGLASRTGGLLITRAGLAPRLAFPALIVVLTALILSVPQAHAVPLVPGDTVSLGGTTSIARPELIGPIIAEVSRPFSFSGLSGTVVDRVVRESGTGTLDFYWQIAVLDGSIDFIVRESFTGFSTDVDFRTDDTGDQGPASAFRSLVVSPPGSFGVGEEVLFDWDGSLDQGKTSLSFFIKTDATVFNDQGRGFLVGSNCCGTIEGVFQPVQRVPEPGSLFLVASGLIASGMVRRLRRPKP